MSNAWEGLDRDFKPGWAPRVSILEPITLTECELKEFEEAMKIWKQSGDYKRWVATPLRIVPWDGRESVTVLKERIDVLEKRLLALGGSVE